MDHRPRARVWALTLAGLLLLGAVGCGSAPDPADYTFACNDDRPCASGFACLAGVCVRPGAAPPDAGQDDDGGCQPACGEAECGPDGCGGQCGTCPSGSDCVAGQCAAPSACAAVPPAGCCRGDVAVWCEGGALHELDCATEYGADTPCGWLSNQSYYYCRGTGSDPTGTHARDCPVAAPADPATSR